MENCYICNSNKLIEGKFMSKFDVNFVAITGEKFWESKSVSSKLCAIACKDCGTIVRMKALDTEGLKKL